MKLPHIISMAISHNKALLKKLKLKEERNAKSANPEVIDWLKAFSDIQPPDYYSTLKEKIPEDFLKKKIDKNYYSNNYNINKIIDHSDIIKEHSNYKCPDGLIPDGDICPKCGKTRESQWGVWVHKESHNYYEDIINQLQKLPAKTSTQGRTDSMDIKTSAQGGSIKSSAATSSNNKLHTSDPPITDDQVIGRLCRFTPKDSLECYGIVHSISDNLLIACVSDNVDEAIEIYERIGSDAEQFYNVSFTREETEVLG